MNPVTTKLKLIFSITFYVIWRFKILIRVSKLLSKSQSWKEFLFTKSGLYKCASVIRRAVS